MECGDGEGRCHSGVEAGIGGPRTGVSFVYRAVLSLLGSDPRRHPQIMDFLPVTSAQALENFDLTRMRCSLDGDLIRTRGSCNKFPSLIQR